MKQKIRILIADDHRMVRKGIKLMLKSQKLIAPIVEEAANGSEVLDLSAKLVFDVILMDMQMPKVDGVSTTKILRKNGLKTPIIAISAQNNWHMINLAIKYGVNGIISKNSDERELVKAILTVCNNESYYCNEITQLILSNKKRRSGTHLFIQELTKRELEVLKLIAEDYGNDEIAKFLGLSIRTIEGYRKNLKQKLCVKSTIGLVRYAYEMNIVA